MRIPNNLLDNLIENEGTVDGINVPNITGILRLALDLRDARVQLDEQAREVARLQALLDGHTFILSHTPVEHTNYPKGKKKTIDN